MNKHMSIIDRRLINLHNYEQRLRKLRNVVSLLLLELDEGLENLDEQKRSDCRVVDALVKDA